MIRIKVAYATPKQQHEISLEVEESCTPAIAIRRSGILELFSEIHLANITIGIYGKKVALDAMLRDGDRIEIYRPLRMDPKQARLLRAQTAAKKG